MILIVFTIIWISQPISYKEMRSRHSIYLQENALVVKNSSILTQNNELKFLESTIRSIILAKDISGSFFAEGFTSPLPRRASSIENQIATGQNAGPSGGNSNPDSGSKADRCSSNPTPNFPPEVLNYGLA